MNHHAEAIIYEEGSNATESYPNRGRRQSLPANDDVAGKRHPWCPAMSEEVKTLAYSTSVSVAPAWE